MFTFDVIWLSDEQLRRTVILVLCMVQVWPDVKGAYVIGSLVWKHSSTSSQLCAVWYNLPLSLSSALISSIGRA